jgi:uncharacterized membrane protein
MICFLLTDTALFLGRFHPLIVHLPIGFLLLAVLLEVWPGERARPAIGVAWAVGALSAIAAAGAGWLLASGGDYGGDVLFWHRWAGVAVAVMATAGYFVQRRGGITAKVYGLMTAAALTLAGHQGGNLTHGEDYLFEHAPPVVQQLTGHVADTSGRIDWDERDLDSINLFATFLKPAINDKCVRCHNDQKQNGDLRMDSFAFLIQGGDSGPLYAAGNPHDSRWINRVTLPRRNAKAMPPQGERLSYTETELLAYWIETGADSAYVLDPEHTPAYLKKLLLRDYGLHLRPRLFVEKLRVPPLDRTVRNGLEEMNWSVSDLVPGGPALEVKPRPGKHVTPRALEELAAAAGNQVAYLSLDNQDFSDKDLRPLSRFPHLNRLRLNGNTVTAATVAQLAELDHLESLNLYNTPVNDDIFPHLLRFPALERLYLWRSEVSAGAVNAFSSDRPGVAVDTGSRLVTTTEEVSKK